MAAKAKNSASKAQLEATIKGLEGKLERSDAKADRWKNQAQVDRDVPEVEGGAPRCAGDSLSRRLLIVHEDLGQAGGSASGPPPKPNSLPSGSRKIALRTPLS